MTKPSAFWDDRFADTTYIYGRGPNAFVEKAAEAALSNSHDVLALGAGEGRNAVFLAQQGHTVTAVDYSTEGLRKTRRLAADANVTVETIQADVREWTPEQTWDTVVTTFLHLPPDARPRLYNCIQTCLCPAGRLIAEWFRPEQRTEGYTSGGPPDPDMMITPDELRTYFAEDGIEHLEIAEPMLEEGMHEGLAATVQFIWRRR